jgi:predicted RND superfamily exporter protein
MTDARALLNRATYAPLAAGILVTILAAIALSGLRLDGDIYALLGPDDPAVLRFNEFAAVTPGLEELLIVCPPGKLPGQDTVSAIASIQGIDEHTRTYYQPGKSTVQSFSLSVDPADWHQTNPVIKEVRSLLADRGANCGLTGTPPIVFDMQSRLDADLKTALLIAAGLVSLMFAFVYRIGFLALFMLIPVVAGIGWGLAAYSLLRTELTLLAATVPTLLIGIGIDHCIHLIQSCRYSMAKDGLQRNDAVLKAWKRLLAPITLASLTTAVTFAALTTAELRGLADLGWSGMLVTLGVYAACISMLPAILLLSPTRWLTRIALFDRPIRRLAPFLKAHAGLLAALIVMIGAASFYGITRLEALDDNRLLESGDLESIALQERIATEHGLSSSPMLLRFSEPGDAIELLAEIERPALVGSLLTVPDVQGLVQLHPLQNTFIRNNFQAMTASLEEWIPSLGLGEFELSGAPVMNERINELVYRDVRIVLPIAFVAILLVLALGTRSLLKPCLVLLPLALALVCLVGTMGLLGIAASVVTVAITPLVLGIGVDGGVHLLAAWERHRGQLVEMFAETGLAIVVTVVTSVTAFAAFLFSKTPSLVYFGSQASTALLGCLVVTLVVLPYLFRVLLPPLTETPQDVA